MAAPEGSLPPVVIDDGDEDADEREDEENVTPPHEMMEIPDIIEKKKKTRQEVDPAKYFEVRHLILITLNSFTFAHIFEQFYFLYW